MIAHINIGSNLGDRLSNIGRAVSFIESHFRSKAVVSPPFHSQPWGYASAHEYINVGLNIEIGQTTPLKLLDITTAIQRSIDPAPHRDLYGNYTDRTIDIDIIAIDSIVIDTPSLTLPHPRMHLRPFVLEPLARVWPQWHHPISGMTPTQLLNTLSD